MGRASIATGSDHGPTRVPFCLQDHWDLTAANSAQVAATASHCARDRNGEQAVHGAGPGWASPEGGSLCRR